MRTLAGITLHPGVLWIDRQDWQPVSLSSARTTAGGMVWARQTLTGGRPVTLSWQKPFAWVTWEEMLALKTAIQAPSMAFFWDNDSGLVTLAGTDGLVVNPLANTNPSSADRFFITIKLIMVN